MEEKEVYLDNSATTKVCDAAAESALNAMKVDYGNADSLHRMGFRAEQLITESAKETASFLGCQDSEILFTSGATESNNIALFGVTRKNPGKRNKIITTAIEHASVEGCMRELSENGYEIIEIMPDADGRYDPLDFYHAAGEDTALVSVIHVNNETGLVLPVREIGLAVKRKNPKIIFHIDAVQAFLKYPVSLRSSPIDLMTASGHKAHAPKGVGILYIRKGVHVKPFLFGAGEIRSGTKNVPLIAAFGAAVRVQKDLMAERMEHFCMLKKHLADKTARIPEISLNSTDDCAPYIVNLSVSKIRSEIMLHYLEDKGIYVSSGSACSKGRKSRVLAAMGFPEERVDTALRISFSAENTVGDVDYFIKHLQAGIKTLIKMK